MTFHKGENNHTRKHRKDMDSMHQDRRRREMSEQRRQAVLDCCTILNDIERDLDDRVCDIADQLDPFWSKSLLARGFDNE